MRTRTTFVLVACCLLAAVAVTADEFIDYPEFRYISGLPGGGFAVDPLGRVGFDGALQINIPVGYTPGAGNYAACGSAAAINGGFPDEYKGDDINGNFSWGVGLFGHEHALWLMDMGTGHKRSFESAYNGQFQIVPETENHPGIAIGVTDAYTERTKNLLDPFAGNATSFFAVATREAGTPEHPLYLTLGYGNGRFNSRPFGGVSYSYSDRLKLAAEYDGWNPNFAVAWDAARYEDNWHLITMVSATDWDRLQVSVALTRSPHK